MYRRSRVSTLTRSPTFTNSGTWTTAPVSSVAAFVTLETVSPLTPGSVSTTESSTEAGSWMPAGRPSTVRSMTELEGWRNSIPSTSVRGRFTCSNEDSSMNTTSSPASYRYWTLFVSVRTRGIFSPARKVLSTTEPESRLFSFVRTNAPPFPGFTCWNSTIRQTCPSSSTCMPFRNWFVETTSATEGQFRWLIDNYLRPRRLPINQHLHERYEILGER